MGVYAVSALFHRVRQNGYPPRITFTPPNTAILHQTPPVTAAARWSGGVSAKLCLYIASVQFPDIFSTLIISTGHLFAVFRILNRDNRYLRIQLDN